MNVHVLTVGQLQTNCYLVYDSETSKAIIIDPGDDAEYIDNHINDLKIRPIVIIATHAHYDHLLSTLQLQLQYKIPLLLNKLDQFLLNRSQKSAQHFGISRADPIPEPDGFLKNGDWLIFGKEKLKVIETPGHTPGSISLYSSGILFSGDTLFADGVGRTDFSYCSKADLDNSLKKLFKLPGNTIVYPGHGKSAILRNIIIT